MLENLIFRSQIEKCNKLYCSSDFDPKSHDKCTQLYFSSDVDPKVEKHYVRVAALPPAGQQNMKTKKPFTEKIPCCPLLPARILGTHYKSVRISRTHCEKNDRNIWTPTIIDVDFGKISPLTTPNLLPTNHKVQKLSLRALLVRIQSTHQLLIEHLAFTKQNAPARER